MTATYSRVIDIENDPQYQLIKYFYTGKVARRSQVPYMNHICEGLVILQYIGAPIVAQQAFCLHPIFQNDNDFMGNIHNEIALNALKCCNQLAIVYALEYRAVANAYLSRRIISDVNEVNISFISAINQMLIADKIQNYKDFRRHLDGRHERTQELHTYFQNWLKRLGIRLEDYEQITLGLESRAAFLFPEDYTTL